MADGCNTLRFAESHAGRQLAVREKTIPTCREMSELVTDYMEGGLSPAQRLRARWHLFLCVACRRYFDQFRRTVGFVAEGVPRRPPAPEIETQLLDAAVKTRASSHEKDS